MDADEVNWESGEDHDAPHPGLEGPGDHGDDGDEDGGQDVEDGPDQAHPDGPLPLRMLPPEPGDAEDGHPDRDLENVNTQSQVLYALKDLTCGTYIV